MSLEFFRRVNKEFFNTTHLSADIQRKAEGRRAFSVLLERKLSWLRTIYSLLYCIEGKGHCPFRSDI